MELLIGCPVSRRGWVLPSWLYYIERACESFGTIPQYIFACSPEDPTANFLLEVNRFQERKTHFVWTDEKERIDSRDWNDARFLHMTGIRNALLRRVRTLNPTYFLSIDSDILLHPDALGSMLDLMSRFDAVGGKCYMTAKGQGFPSNGLLARDGFRRIDSEDVMTVDIIMAIKLMSSAAYHIDYKFDQRGEDLGWSENCRASRLKLGWDGRISSKHVMNPQSLLEIDPRVGY